jgi:hypothetical protein
MSRKLRRSRNADAGTFVVENNVDARCGEGDGVEVAIRVDVDARLNWSFTDNPTVRSRLPKDRRA